MAYLNKVAIIGNLGADPELRTMPNGDAVANIAVATAESWKDKTTGDKKNHTEWHRIVFYRKLAEIVGKYLRKGASIYVEGKLRTRKWTDKDGIEHYTTEIVGESMQMLGARGAQNGQGGSAPFEGGGGGVNGQDGGDSAASDEWLKDYDRQMATEAAAAEAGNKPRLMRARRN